MPQQPSSIREALARALMERAWRGIYAGRPYEYQTAVEQLRDLARDEVLEQRQALDWALAQQVALGQVPPREQERAHERELAELKERGAAERARIAERGQVTAAGLQAEAAGRGVTADVRVLEALIQEYGTRVGLALFEQYKNTPEIEREKIRAALEGRKVQAEAAKEVAKVRAESEKTRLLDINSIVRDVIKDAGLRPTKEEQDTLIDIADRVIRRLGRTQKETVGASGAASPPAPTLDILEQPGGAFLGGGASPQNIRDLAAILASPPPTAAPPPRQPAPSQVPTVEEARRRHAERIIGTGSAQDPFRQLFVPVPGQEAPGVPPVYTGRPGAEWMPWTEWGRFVEAPIFPSGDVYRFLMP